MSEPEPEPERDSSPATVTAVDSSSPAFGDLVDALYHALLGRGPDDEGRAHWIRVGSLEALAKALVLTDEFQRRAMAVFGGAEAAEQRHVRAAMRLEHHRGRGPVGDLPVGLSTIDVLETFPWAEVVDGLLDAGGAPVVQVLGPYSEELCLELRRRHGAIEAVAGLLDDRHLTGPGHRDAIQRPDVLVLTEPEYLETLVWSRPLQLDRADRRLVVPFVLGAAGAVGELTALSPRVRSRLHGFGFVEVRCTFVRRFGGATIHLDTSHVTPDLGRPRTVVHNVADASSLPAAVWFVADRLPRCELR